MAPNSLKNQYRGLSHAYKTKNRSVPRPGKFRKGRVEGEEASRLLRDSAGHGRILVKEVGHDACGVRLEGNLRGSREVG